MFLYSDIQWTTGDSGGKYGFGVPEALAGINSCDGVNDIIIPGSLTPNIIDTARTSNVNISGLWVFRVDQKQGNIVLSLHSFLCLHFINSAYIGT